MLKKILKYLLLGLLLLVIVVLGGGYYLLNTNSGLQQTIALANRYSGYQVSADEINGKLLGKTELKNLSVSGKNLDISGQTVVLDWDAGALFDKSLVVKAIRIDGAVVQLMPGETEPEQPRQPMVLDDIKLPLDIHLQDLLITNLSIKNPVTEGSDADPAGDIVIDKIQLGIDYIGQKGSIHTLIVEGLDSTLSLKGDIETQGDFPLHLQTSGDYANQQYGQQQLSITIDGALKETLNLQIAGQGVADFRIDGQVQALLAEPAFTAAVDVSRVDGNALGMKNTLLMAQLNTAGSMGDKLMLSAAGNVFYDSPESDKIQLNIDGNFDGEVLLLSQLNVNLLTAKQQLSGKGQYHLGDKTLQVQFNSEALHWPQNAQRPALAAENLRLTANGTIENYHIELTADTITDAVGKVPIQLSADGNLQALTKMDLQAQLNEQPLTISGQVAWQPKIAYQARIQSAAITPFLQFPGLKDVDITASGDDKTYRADGHLHIYADSIAPSDVVLKVNGSLTELQQADITVNTLGGTAAVAAKGALSPLDLNLQLSSKNIQPQRFYADINANITTTLTAQVQQSADNLTAQAVIETLTGQLQNYPLSGSGSINFDQKKAVLNVNDLNVNLAGNRLAANGLLSLDEQQGQSDLTARLDAGDLKRLLPDLAGALNADIIAKGNISTPQIQATIRGNNIAYQHHRVKTLNAKADISLTDDRVQLSADVADLQSGDTLADKATLTVQGKISAHQLRADIALPKTAAIPSLTLAGKGGFDRQTLAWTGDLQQLNVNNDLIGQWQLGKTAALTLSAETIRIGDFCLQQQAAQLCVDGQMGAGNGDFDIAVKQIKTQQFEHFIPENIKVKTIISGKAQVQLRNGTANVNGKINADGGTFTLKTGSGSLRSKIRQFETTIALQNNRLQGLLAAEFSRLGKINISANIPNIQHSELRANIKIDNKSLKFIEDLVPQLSEVSGHLSGDMTVAGTPGKALNVAGKITLHETDFDVPQFATEIRDLTLDVFAKDGNTFGFKGHAKAGSGNFVVDGDLNPATQRGSINLKGENFQVANSRKIKVAISPDLSIVFADDIQIRGDVLIPKALIVPESSTNKITASEDVVQPGKSVEKQSTSSPIDVEISVTLGDDVRVASADIETRLNGALNVTAKPGKAPSAAGTIAVQTGELRIYGQLLNIERGRVIFSNGPIANPALDIRTSREIESENIIVGANVLGTVQRPEVSLFSTPSMSDSSILSYLLFGRPPSADSFGTMALLQTGGVVGANTLARDLRTSTGLDVLDFSLAGLEAGKNLSKKMYVGMKSSFFSGISQFLADYKINSKLKAEAAASSAEMSIDLIRTVETD